MSQFFWDKFAPLKEVAVRTVVTLVAALVFGGGLVFAQATVDLNWNTYGGGLSAQFQAGNDTYVGFWTGGNHFFGELHWIDYLDNPYHYNVDTVRAKIMANIDTGGYLEFLMERQDSYQPMYGPAGQKIYTYLSTSDLGFFATNTTTNYAEMITYNYGWRNDSQWKASGEFFIVHYIKAGNQTSGAGFQAAGDGSIDITLMSSELHGLTGWRFGEGAGCYTNAHASGTGSGQFNVYGYAPNVINAFGATINGGSVLFQINYNNGFSTANNLNMSGY